MTVRAAIYLRVSSPEQAKDDRYSLSVQERTCRAVAVARGDDVVAVYTDAGNTAFRDELECRPEFQRLLADAPSRQWGRLYVLALDRFSRASMAASGEWLRTLERSGVELVSALEWFDSSPSGELLRTILLGQAHYFSRLQGQKISGALREKQRSGLWVGVWPYGYTAGPDKALIIDDGAAEMYHMAVKLVLEGEENISEVCRMLTAAGYRTSKGGPWHTKALQGMLKSVAYLGMVTLEDGTVVPGQHPPLIDRAEWELLQARLRASARPNSGRRPRSCYPLSGILRCPFCDSHMIGGSRSERRYCYICARRNRLGIHHDGIAYFWADACEELIARELDNLRLGDGWREAVEREMAQGAQPKGPSLSEIKRQERNLMDMYQMGAFHGDRAEFKRRWDALQTLRADRDAPNRPGVLQVGELLQSGLGRIWRASTDGAAKRRLARLLFRAVYIIGESSATPVLERPVVWQPEVEVLLRL